MDLYFKGNIERLLEDKKFLEKKLGAKFEIKGREIHFTSDGLQEYEISLVFEALEFGFPAKIAVDIMDETIVFRKINIKDFTRRKNLSDVRARIIGTKGKTRKTLEEITGFKIMIKEKEVGFVGPAEDVDKVTTGITKIIRGAKQSNSYRFLEKMNAKDKTVI